MLKGLFYNFQIFLSSNHPASAAVLFLKALYIAKYDEITKLTICNVDMDDGAIVALVL